MLGELTGTMTVFATYASFDTTFVSTYECRLFSQPSWFQGILALLADLAFNNDTSDVSKVLYRNRIGNYSLGHWARLGGVTHYIDAHSIGESSLKLDAKKHWKWLATSLRLAQSNFIMMWSYVGNYWRPLCGHYQTDQPRQVFWLPVICKAFFASNFQCCFTNWVGINVAILHVFFLSWAIFV